MKLYELSIHEAGRLLARREISARELTAAVLERLAALDGDIGAYLTVTPEAAFEAADVMNLPHAADSFDFASIAFGIRNVRDAVQGLREMGRVTRPGGRVLVLEFGQVEAPVLKQAYNLYARKLLPCIGGWVTGNRRAYDYLEASSSRMECREAFLARMAETGSLAESEYRPLMGGIAFMYRARSV